MLIACFARRAVPLALGRFRERRRQAVEMPTAVATVAEHELSIIAFVPTDFALFAFDASPVVGQSFADLGWIAAPPQARGMSAAAAFVARDEQLGCVALGSVSRLQAECAKVVWCSPLNCGGRCIGRPLLDGECRFKFALLCRRAGGWLCKLLCANGFRWRCRASGRRRSSPEGSRRRTEWLNGHHRSVVG